jgi:rod shape-determining protein MreC
MEHQPPPFFKTGPTPLARLLIFSALSIVILVADARFNLLAVLRQAAAVVLYPVQRVAAAPVNLARRAGEFFVTHASLREENARLAQERLERALALQQLQAVHAENAQLRALLAARERIEPKAKLAEVAYSARDPFSRRIVVDRGSQQDVKSGQPVIDHSGVIGQVTRVYPWVSEVTLITDKDHLVPVLNVRNGLRAVLAGTGDDGALELRFVPLNADFRSGDRLVTSGIDGVYPPGLPVADVTHVDRNAALLFARITCKPLGGVRNNSHVLIVSGARELPERPAEEEEKPVRPRKGRKG